MPDICQEMSNDDDDDDDDNSNNNEDNHKDNQKYNHKDNCKDNCNHKHQKICILFSHKFKLIRFKFSKAYIVLALND